jgi:hypothetical protein
MKHLFILIAVICAATSCMAQSTNSESTTTSRSKPVRGIQMSISMANNVVAAGSSFFVTIEITNSSTNSLRMAETAPEGIFTVVLADGFRRTYQLTRSSEFFNRSLVSYLEPGQSRTWIIHVDVNQYFESPGLVPTNQDVPPGEYLLKAIGGFRFKNGTAVGLESDLKVQIK